jgi:hypothetical protein
LLQPDQHGLPALAGLEVQLPPPPVILSRVFLIRFAEKRGRLDLLEREHSSLHSLGGDDPIGCGYAALYRFDTTSPGDEFD